MFKSFFASKVWAIWAWGGLLFLAAGVYIQVQISVEFNSFYKEFYDLLQKADKLGEEGLVLFYQQLLIFAKLAFLSISIAVINIYFARHYAFRWRQAMSFYYLHGWKNTVNNIEGASQRIQDDTKSFAYNIESMGLGMLNAVLTLIAFIPILSALSEKVSISWLQFSNSLVLVAIIMSAGGLLVSWFVGMKLPGLEYNNQKVEAAYRKELVYSEDDRDRANMPSMVELFTNIRYNYFRLFNHYTYFNIWENFYFQFLIILPYILMGPSLFYGVVTLGFISQTGNAFGKVVGSFSFFIDRWVQVNELRSIHKRLKEFEKNMDKLDISNHDDNEFCYKTLKKISK